eukprot:7839832-Pyramimonas_sp.AAC.1
MPPAIPMLFHGAEYSMLERTPGFIASRVREATSLASTVQALGRVEGGWVSALRWGPLGHLLAA